MNTSNAQLHMQLAKQDIVIEYEAPHMQHPFLKIASGCAPSGSMSCRFNPQQYCPGFPEKGLISILYDIPSDVQKSYMKNPGQSHASTRRIAYLPASAAGCSLLSRFKIAFSRGFMFNVGYSLTNKQDNQITWSTIPNKTSLSGGPFGFPDNNYIAKANAELDKLAVPNENDCLQLVQQISGPVATPNVPNYPSISETIAYNAPEQLGAANGDFTSLLEPITTSSSYAPPSVPPLAASTPLAPPIAASYIDNSLSGPPIAASSIYIPPSAPAPAAKVPRHSSGASMAPAKIISVDDLNDNGMNQKMPPVAASAPMMPPPIAASAPMMPPPVAASTPMMPPPVAASTPMMPPPISASTPMMPPPISAPASSNDEECAICLSELSKEPSVKIIACHHAFHRACIVDALKHIDKCPVCRKPLSASGAPQGKCPSGTMKIETTSDSCPGFGCTTIEIRYDMPSGIQKKYHENPGVRYQGTVRIAYLPNNVEGRNLLKRLKYAWKNGLTFRIGTSLTTGQQNQVTWTSIHHKTSLSGGVHGYPDNSYLGNCNSSLDALEVPPADQI